MNLPRLNLLLTAVLALGASAAHAAEPYSPYDNFSNTTLSASKWTNLERTRVVDNGVLKIVQRDLGDQYTNTGTRRNSYGVDFNSPAEVTQMRATLRVKSTTTTGCSANPEPADVQARLIGGFFATATGTAGNQQGDVVALARLTRRSNSTDGTGVLRVEGVVLQCAASDCQTYGFLEIVDLGTAVLDQAVDLRMNWDKSNKRFRFSRDGGSYVNVDYEVSDALPPNSPFKSVQTRTILPHCLTGDRAVGRIQASFDNVQVNESAAP